MLSSMTKASKTKVLRSKYSTDLVSAAEYITELICEKIAVKERKPLSTKFWMNSFWQPIYKRQLHIAKSLLKLYPYQVIIAALKNEKSQKIYSLGMATSLDPIIQEELQKYKNLLNKETIVVEDNSIEKPRAQQNKQVSIINKLRNLD